MISFKEKIFLYEDPSSKTLNLKEIKDYLEENLNLKTETRKDFIGYYLDRERIKEYAQELALCKVRNLHKLEDNNYTLPGEVRFEEKLIKYPERRMVGILYDGYKLHKVFQGLIPKIDLNLIHIVFTNRLFGTFEDRYHARVIMCGYPCIISTTGIVEAPAKPREFYYLKYLMPGLGIPEYKGKGFIDYDDPRLTEVMKGYAMQSVFYSLTLEPFCEDKKCRLYNAHWQEEVINAQLRRPEFCKKHERILKSIRNGFYL